jgi:hypothetical protein
MIYSFIKNKEQLFTIKKCAKFKKSALKVITNGKIKELGKFIAKN